MNSSRAGRRQARRRLPVDRAEVVARPVWPRARDVAPPPRRMLVAPHADPRSRRRGKSGTVPWRVPGCSRARSGRRPRTFSSRSVGLRTRYPLEHELWKRQRGVAAEAALLGDERRREDDAVGDHRQEEQLDVLWCTYSRPSSSAQARAVRSSARLARTEAPSDRSSSSRVAGRARRSSAGAARRCRRPRPRAPARRRRRASRPAAGRRAGGPRAARARCRSPRRRSGSRAPS